jgi:CubicO group peptidase (beta-lactamase class C family)
MRKKIYFIHFVIFLVVFCFSRDKGFIFSPPQREIIRQQVLSPFNWPVSTPEAQGLDSGIFENALEAARKLEFVDSLLVVRNGYLIAEGYFNGFDQNTPHGIASASKTFIGALVGIAVREGLLTLDQKMVDFFPEYVTPNMDPRKNMITIRHLLMMTSGFSDRYLMYSSYRIKYAIEYIPLVVDPGSRWLYSTVGVHILSGIITRVSGMSTLDFARTYLFTPLQISVGSWDTDPQGIYTGGFGMAFVPRDLARFGYLYAQKGVLDGVQVIPADYLRDSWIPHESPGDYWTYSDAIEEVGYGYLWRIGKMGGYQVYGATGHGGQHILVVPEIDMIIVTTGQLYASDTFFQHLSLNRIESFLILHAVRNWLGDPPYAPASAKGAKRTIRSFLRKTYLNEITWQPDPRNPGTEVTGYRIYKIFSPTEKQLLAETDANTYQFWHQGDEVFEASEHVYGITTLTRDQGESIPAFVVIYKPE